MTDTIRNSLNMNSFEVFTRIDNDYKEFLHECEQRTILRKGLTAGLQLENGGDISTILDQLRRNKIVPGNEFAEVQIVQKALIFALTLRIMSEHGRGNNSNRKSLLFQIQSEPNCASLAGDFRIYTRSNITMFIRNAREVLSGQLINLTKIRENILNSSDFEFVKIAFESIEKLREEYDKSREEFENCMDKLQKQLTTTNFVDKLKKAITVDEKRTDVNEMMEKIRSIPNVQADTINEDPTQLSLNFPGNPMTVGVTKCLSCMKPILKCTKSYSKMSELERNYSSLAAYQPLLDFLRSILCCMQNEESYAFQLQMDENNQVVKIDPIKSDIPFLN